MNLFGVVCPKQEDASKAIRFLKNSVAIADYFSSTSEEFFNTLILNIYIIYRFLHSQDIFSERGPNPGPRSLGTFSVKFSALRSALLNFSDLPIDNITFFHHEFLIDGENVRIFSFCINDCDASYLIPISFTGSETMLHDSAVFGRLKRIYKALNEPETTETPVQEYAAMREKVAKQFRKSMKSFADSPSCSDAFYITPRNQTKECYMTTCRVAIYAAMLRVCSHYFTIYKETATRNTFPAFEPEFDISNQLSDNAYGWMRQSALWISSPEVSLEQSVVKEDMQKEHSVYIFVAKCHSITTCGFLCFDSNKRERPLTRELFDEVVLPFLKENKIRHFFNIPKLYSRYPLEDIASVENYQRHITCHVDCYVDCFHSLIINGDAKLIMDHAFFTKVECRIQQVLCEAISRYGLECTERNLPFIFKGMETKLFIHPDKQTVCLVYSISGTKNRRVRTGWVVASKTKQLGFEYQKWAIECYNSYVPEKERRRYRYRDDIVTRCSLSARLSY